VANVGDSLLRLSSLHRIYNSVSDAHTHTRVSSCYSLLRLTFSSSLVQQGHSPHGLFSWTTKLSVLGFGLIKKSPWPGLAWPGLAWRWPQHRAALAFSWKTFLFYAGFSCSTEGVVFAGKNFSSFTRYLLSGTWNHGSVFLCSRRTTVSGFC